MEIKNHINKLENKIDILITKNNYNNECCQCKNREFKIYSDLQEFLECKLNTMNESFLNIITEYSKNVQNDQNDKIIDAINIKSSEHKNDIINTLSSIINVIQPEKTDENFDLNIINQNILTTNKNLNSINSNLSNTNKNVNITNTNLSNYSKSHFESLSNLKSKLIFDDIKTQILESTNKLNENQVLLYNTIIKHTDDLNIKLREDFQEYLLGLETNIKNSVNNKLNISNNETKIQLLTDTIKSLSVKVNDFYFENELIKHQIVLQEELQDCNNEISNIKQLVLATKKSINDTLLSLEEKK